MKLELTIALCCQFTGILNYNSLSIEDLEYNVQYFVNNSNYEYILFPRSLRSNFNFTFHFS